MSFVAYGPELKPPENCFSLRFLKFQCNNYILKTLSKQQPHFRQNSPY
jgi:hypothetical protein